MLHNLKYKAFCFDRTAPKFYKINSLIVFVPRDILDFYFRDDDLLNAITLQPDDLRSLNVQARRSVHVRKPHPVFNDIQALHHEKLTLGAREVTKLLQRDTTPSKDEFPSYVRSIKLIPTTSTTHPVNNETLNLYSEGATLSIFIDKGRPTTTKLTVIALPSSINHSNPCECSKGILCLAHTFHHSPLTKPFVITSYFLRLERKIMLPSTSTICWKTERESTPKKLIYSTSKSGRTFQVGIQSSNSLIKSTQKLLALASTSTLKSYTLIHHQIPTILRPTFITNQVTSSYDTYTMASADQITSAAIEVKIDKSLQFQVNQLNTARVTSITT